MRWDGLWERGKYLIKPPRWKHGRSGLAKVTKHGSWARRHDDRYESGGCIPFIFSGFLLFFWEEDKGRFYTLLFGFWIFSRLRGLLHFEVRGELLYSISGPRKTCRTCRHEHSHNTSVVIIAMSFFSPFRRLVSWLGRDVTNP